jgi:hypothetical protein
VIFVIILSWEHAAATSAPQAIAQETQRRDTMEILMSITRINEFRAKDGKDDALRTFLTRLIPTIAVIPGCQSCQLLHYDNI